ncbi:MAG: hypothetical protein HYY12_05380 [Candidatus Methylomirabilis oxyfera]|nr:hypothetical protein [Candidatus Methylomirabilis oxyfera]
MLGTLYRKACHLGTWAVGRKLARMPGVQGVYAAHSHPSSTSFVPGHSDLDLTLVFDDEVAEVPLRIRECAAAIGRLSRLFYLVWPQDVRFTSRGELNRYLTSLGPPGLLHHPGDWRLIAGKEIRDRAGRYIPADRIPWHPEFNIWWANLLQSKIFAPSDGDDASFLRTFYRGALKSQLHLQDAMGMLVHRPAGYIEDGQPIGEFPSDPDLPDILADLKGRNFWAKDPNDLKSRTLRAILLTVGDFCSNWKAHPENIPIRSLHARSSEEPHRAHYEELERRIRGQSELTSVLEAAVAYPSPHWHPLAYQIDLVFREDVSLGDFAKAIDSLKRGFGGRTFALGATHVQLTVVLKSIYQQPLYFLGSPFPFLREHIQEYGALIYGTPLEAIEGTLSQADLTEWCRLFFPFHMFTFRRRPEYVSKDCNFYQLASLRLFLEDGEIVTDAPRIRQAYLDRFMTKDSDRAVLDYYLQRPGIPVSAELYADAFAFVANQYERVESLLMAGDAGGKFDRA